jgi:mannose-6-phosphate isomerase-like protein (cupin superfamily)
LAAQDYNIKTDVKYQPLEVVDAIGLARAGKDKWWNQTLTRVNDCVVRLGVFEGEFFFHKHDREDEYFQVMEGELHLDIADPPRAYKPGELAAVPNDVKHTTVRLRPGQGLTVPRGVVHRTRAPARTVVIMVEAATVTPTGD